MLTRIQMGIHRKIPKRKHLKSFFFVTPRMFKSDRSIKVNAQCKIKKNEEITIQYLSFQQGNIRRKNAMRDNWHFDCNCVRCQDPTGWLKDISTTSFNPGPFNLRLFSHERFNLGLFQP